VRWENPNPATLTTARPAFSMVRRPRRDVEERWERCP
jgi:hypothetical protein